MTEATGSGPRQSRHTKLKLNYSAIAHSVDEVSELIGLKGNTRQLRARQEIISEGSRYTSPFLLIEGIAIRYRILRDGQRQVLSVILPGDFAGVPSCFFETALYAVRTLTPTTILSIPMSKMVSLFDTHPQVMANWLWTFASETAIYAERLISVSRRPASERVAHFLLELYTRSRQIGLADETSFYLPLTQAVLGDSLGLSIPYVNRVLHQLRDQGMVHVEDQCVIIDNFEALSDFADFESGYLRPLSIESYCAMCAAAPSEKNMPTRAALKSETAAAGPGLQANRNRVGQRSDPLETDH